MLVLTAIRQGCHSGADRSPNFYRTPSLPQRGTPRSAAVKAGSLDSMRPCISRPPAADSLAGHICAGMSNEWGVWSSVIRLTPKAELPAPNSPGSATMGLKPKNHKPKIKFWRAALCRGRRGCHAGRRSGSH